MQNQALFFQTFFNNLILDALIYMCILYSLIKIQIQHVITITSLASFENCISSLRSALASFKRVYAAKFFFVTT